MEKTRDYFIAFLLIAITLLLLEKGCTMKKLDILQDEKSLAQQSYTKERDKYNQLVVKQTAIETYHKRFIDSVAKNFEVKLRGVKAAIEYKYSVTIDTVEIRTTDSLFFYKDTGSNLKIKRFKQITPYYSIDADVDSAFSRLRLNKISFTDTLLVLEKSTGLFVKKTEYQIISKNPYSDISGVKSVKLKPKPRKLLKALEFIAVGIISIKIYEFIR